MDLERWKITAETTALRGRVWLWSAIRLVGLVIVVAGGINLLFASQGSVFPFELYRGVWTGVTGMPAWPLGDFIAIAAGASVVNFL